MQRRFTHRDPAKNGGSIVGDASGDSLQRLKRLDIYARPKREFQRATLHGAAITLVLVAAVASLTWRELVFSMRTETVEKLFVNSTISPTVNVTFDVIFACIPCGMISLDAEDSSGVPQENLRHHVTRTRLDLDGRPLGEGETHEMGNTLKAAIAQEEREQQASKADKDDSKGSNEKGAKKGAGEDGGEEECNCYGAGSEGECCRTCAEVTAAYRRKGWKLDPAKLPICAEQAARSGGAPSPKAPKAEVQTEGCRLAGSLEVTKTTGNFHFAPGHRLHRQATAMSFMDRVQVALESFNTTHTINTLFFGDKPPPGHASPKHTAASTLLEGHHKTVQDTHGMHQYFLQLVPTVYRFTNGDTVHSNQYSATEHLKHVHSGTSQGLPGVYFYYEISPVQALVEETRRGLLAFMTGACGVIGGVYTILGLVNTAIDGVLARRRKHHRSR